MDNTAFHITFFAYLDQKERFSLPCQTYPQTVMICLKSGSFRYKIGNGSWYTAKEKALVLFPADTPIYREALEPMAMIVAKWEGNLPFSIPQEPIYPRDTHRANADIHFLSEQGFAYIPHPDTRICHYVTDLLYTALEDIEASSHPLESAYQYICSHFCQDISVNALAKAHGYTPPRFIALFNKHYGAPPKNIISRLRIQKAQNLLLQTDLPIGEISLACGYEDTLYFSRIFSKYCGLSPSQFRKQEQI